ncbi:hypothetical protein CAOG_00034 [Capsaspora owczarzaki ATCC 30864]|nr:hypothetical protein CAOG_00034 [Capsaspora owczarzaki ATCC 30864]|eukprot:XP_004364905.2 hypothetical protein CAOG_00034 [Capsaspora owczarzaki ATCC 30864]
MAQTASMAQIQSQSPPSSSRWLRVAHPPCARLVNCLTAIDDAVALLTDTPAGLIELHTLNDASPAKADDGPTPPLHSIACRHQSPLHTDSLTVTSTTAASGVARDLCSNADSDVDSQPTCFAWLAHNQQDPTRHLEPESGRQHCLLAVGTQDCRVLVFDFGLRVGSATVPPKLVYTARVAFIPADIALTLVQNTDKVAVIITGVCGIAVLPPFSISEPSSQPVVVHHTFPFYGTSVCSVDVSPCSGWIAFGCYDGRVAVFPITPALFHAPAAFDANPHHRPRLPSDCIWLLPSGGARITSIAFSSSGTFCAFSTWEGHVHVAAARQFPADSAAGAEVPAVALTWSLLPEGSFFLGESTKAIETHPAMVLAWAPLSTNGNNAELLVVGGHSPRIAVVQVSQSRLVVHQALLDTQHGVRGLCTASSRQSRFGDVVVYTRDSTLHHMSLDLILRTQPTAVVFKPAQTLHLHPSDEPKSRGFAIPEVPTCLLSDDNGTVLHNTKGDLLITWKNATVPEVVPANFVLFSPGSTIPCTISPRLFAMYASPMVHVYSRDKRSWKSILMDAPCLEFRFTDDVTIHLAPSHSAAQQPRRVIRAELAPDRFALKLLGLDAT